MAESGLRTLAATAFVICGQTARSQLLLAPAWVDSVGTVDHLPQLTCLVSTVLRLRLTVAYGLLITKIIASAAYCPLEPSPLQSEPVLMATTVMVALGQTRSCSIRPMCLSQMTAPF
jgi:hypothetical protein